MIIEILIPILSIIGAGIFLFNLFSKFQFQFMFAEKFIFVIILGTGIIVVPMMFFGLQQDFIFFQIWPLLISLGGLFYIGILSYIKFQSIISNFENIPNPVVIQTWFKSLNDLGRQKLLLYIIIGALFGGFTIFQVMLPLRGYDSLWMYIPDSLWFYRLNSFSELNLLNFRAITKEPLHTLLFTQTLYSTGKLFIHLIPILFLFAWLLIIYSFSIKLWGNENKALVSVLFFLVIPFLFYLINFWAYYQDIFVGFFYSATIYCLYNITKLNYKDNKYQIYFLLFLGSLSFGLSVLAKLSGWVLIFSIILLYPTIKKIRIISLLFLIGVSTFLIFKISVHFYVGFGLFIGIISIMIVYFMNKNDRYFKNNFRLEWYGMMIIPIGIIIGGYWLYATLVKFSQYNSSLINQYFLLPLDTFKFEFNELSLNNASFKIESAHASNFFAVILFLLVGNMFVLFWILPKFRAILDEKLSFFVIWILSFYIVWITFHGLSSIRYLTPVIIPVVLIVTHGVYLLVEDITKVKNHISNKIIILFCILSYLSYFFPVPLELLFSNNSPMTISNSFLYSAYFYYSNSILFLIFALLISLIVYYYFKNNNKFKLNNNFNLLSKFRVIPFLIIILIISFPFTVPFVVFLNSNFNVDEFNSKWNYHQRTAYKEVVEILLEQNSPNSGIIVFNMPGLPLYLNQPTIDFFVQSDLLFPLQSSNIPDMLNFLLNPIEYAKNYIDILQEIPYKFSFDFIVIPSFNHLFNSFFVKNYYQTSVFFPLLFNTDLFNNIFENDEFLIFERKFQDSNRFEGVINTYLSDSYDFISIFGKIFEKKTFSNNLSLEISGFYPKLNFTKLQINSTIHVTQNKFNLLLNQSQSISKILNDGEITFKLLLSSMLQDVDPILIQKIEINLYYDEFNPFLSKKIILYPSDDGIKLIFDPNNNLWSVNQSSGLIV